MCTKAERVGRLAAGSTPHRVVVRTGSTPHVRGKLLGVGVQVVHVGLNPTYAGKTLPDKALCLQDARITSTFPVWGE